MGPRGKARQNAAPAAVKPRCADAGVSQAPTPVKRRRGKAWDEPGTRKNKKRLLHVVAEVRQRRLGVAKRLRAGGLAVADADNLIYELVSELFHRLRAVNSRLGIEIDVVGHGAGRSAVGGQAQHRRDGVSCGRAQVRGEDHELAAAGDDAADVGRIVAGVSITTSPW